MGVDTNFTPANTTLWEAFCETYEEFKNIDANIIFKFFVKISCLYPKYQDLYKTPYDVAKCDLYFPYFMLVAHYIVINGYAEKIGINRPNGLVANSSIDGVSVGYQTAPFNNNYDYFFGQTPYGLEYLAYLASITGARYIN